jgi:hypothetical protein
MTNPPFHKFIVFSILEDDEIVPKLAQCNNCGIVHRVVDVCRSEIINGKEHAHSILTIDDLRKNMSPQLAELLDSCDADLATWEAVRFIIDTEQWGNFVVVTSDSVDNMRQGKYIRLLGKTLYKIDTFVFDDVLSLK